MLYLVRVFIFLSIVTLGNAWGDVPTQSTPVSAPKNVTSSYSQGICSIEVAHFKLVIKPADALAVQQATKKTSQKKFKTIDVQLPSYNKRHFAIVEIASNQSCKDANTKRGLRVTELTFPLPEKYDCQKNECYFDKSSVSKNNAKILADATLDDIVNEINHSARLAPEGISSSESWQCEVPCFNCEFMKGPAIQQFSQLVKSDVELSDWMCAFTDKQVEFERFQKALKSAALLEEIMGVPRQYIACVAFQESGWSRLSSDPYRGVGMFDEGTVTSLRSYISSNSTESYEASQKSRSQMQRYLDKINASRSQKQEVTLKTFFSKIRTANWNDLDFQLAAIALNARMTLDGFLSAGKPERGEKLLEEYLEKIDQNAETQESDKSKRDHDAGFKIAILLAMIHNRGPAVLESNKRSPDNFSAESVPILVESFGKGIPGEYVRNIVSKCMQSGNFDPLERQNGFEKPQKEKPWCKSLRRRKTE